MIMIQINRKKHNTQINNKHNKNIIIYSNSKTDNKFKLRKKHDNEVIVEQRVSLNITFYNIFYRLS
jgi:hypothetical protein